MKTFLSFTNLIIGEYINSNTGNFEVLSKTMEQFKTIYQTLGIIPNINSFIKSNITSNNKKKSYSPELTDT
jgi:hypothetical protein